MRELSNVLERSLLDLKGDVLHSLKIAGARKGRPDALAERSTDPSLDGTWKEVRERGLAELERHYLIRLMQSFRGNVSAAAPRAGMSRNSVTVKLKKHGILADDFRPSRRK